LLKIKENPPIIWGHDLVVHHQSINDWPTDKSISEFTGQWWVAHTKSRNEKALAQDLMAKNIPYFLPMTAKTTRIRSRKIKSLLPLFSGYLFFCGEENQRLETLRTNRVANIIEVAQQQVFLDELLKIEQAFRVGADVTPHKYIKKGQICKVTAGPLVGMQGVVVHTKGTARLVLQIDMLGQAASVEIDTDIIEVIDQT